VIYARQSFCDPGAYDALLAAELAREQGLPFLEVEVGFPLEVSGPLRTRIEAFLEAQLLDEDLLGESNQIEGQGRPGALGGPDGSDDLSDEGLLEDDLFEDDLFEDRPSAKRVENDPGIGWEG
jgi:hypothetical protein